MNNFRKKMIQFLQSFWGSLAFGILTFAFFIIIDLSDSPLNTLGWRDWLGSAVGAAIMSTGMFTLGKMNLK
ncbi:hypothetical protein [Bacillus pseudomycoides]|uniref:hypothetical protein n=1 Tax=Bacillus pseudomycoides TaxID=64104 RepID=UPI000BF65F4B|nr:hypothetical protein [Bacillus pseudomycoides]PGF06098.1 hypothetical protein COM59_26330 [Bacillus pseudomycoides]